MGITPKMGHWPIHTSNYIIIDISWCVLDDDGGGNGGNISIDSSIDNVDGCGSSIDRDSGGVDCS